VNEALKEESCDLAKECIIRLAKQIEGIQYYDEKDFFDSQGRMHPIVFREVI